MISRSFGKPTALVAAAAFLAALPAAAQEGEQDEARVQQESSEEQRVDDSDEVICRTEKVIGSRAKRRKTCLTRAQWEEVASRGNSFARSLVESGRSGMWETDPGG